MDAIIGLKYFRNNIQKIANRVAKGETFIVIRWTKPVFRVVPVGYSTSHREKAKEFLKSNRRKA